MRIAHLVDRPADIGGVATYLLGLLPALRAHGVDNVVVSGDATVAEIADTPCVHAPDVASDAARLDRDGSRRLAAVLHSTDADVVYAHLARNPGVVATAAAQAPVVLYAHDYHPVCPGSARYLHRRGATCREGAGLRCFSRAYTERCTNRRPDRLARAVARTREWRGLLPQLSRVLVASPFVAELLAGDGVPSERLRVVPYFVQAPPAVSAATETDVLYLGRLVASKGVHVLLQALARMDAAVTATVAGDGPERPALERLAGELGLGARVRFVGWVSSDERPRLLATTRVVAVPSLWDEPFGMVGVESLAAGVPVVGTRVGGIPSWLADGEGGQLVPRGDAAALAGALGRLLGDDRLLAEQAERGRTAAARFSVERHVELLLPELQAATTGR